MGDVMFTPSPEKAVNIHKRIAELETERGRGIVSEDGLTGSKEVTPMMPKLDAKIVLTKTKEKTSCRTIRSSMSFTNHKKKKGEKCYQKQVVKFCGQRAARYERKVHDYDSSSMIIDWAKECDKIKIESKNLKEDLSTKIKDILLRIQYAIYKTKRKNKAGVNFSIVSVA